MADSITQAPASAVAKAPMAQGPFPRPNMRRLCLNHFKKWAYPCIGLTVLTYVGAYYALYDRHKKLNERYIAELDVDKLYERMKEYGAFKSVKASWQK